MSQTGISQGSVPIFVQAKQKVRKQVTTPPINDKKDIFQSPEVIDNKDVEFEVEGRLVAANKATLCMVSPVLKTLLKGNYQDSKLPRIPLIGKRYNAFVELVEITHVHKHISAENVYDVLPLLHEYQITQLLPTCEGILIHETVSLHLYQLADRFGFLTLQKKCLATLKKLDYFQLKREEKSAYDMLSKDAKIAYLEATMQAQLPKQTGN